MGTSQARDHIRQAIKDKGGVYKVAERTGIHYTRIYAFLRGSGMEADNASRLRAELSELSADVWADVFAPMPKPQRRRAS